MSKKNDSVIAFTNALRDTHTNSEQGLGTAAMLKAQKWGKIFAKQEQLHKLKLEVISLESEMSTLKIEVGCE